MPTSSTKETKPQAEDGTIFTPLFGKSLLAHPFLNKGSAFTAEERDEFDLNGLLPMHVSTVEEQLNRTYANFSAKNSSIEKYIFLASLHDRNETLFYKLLQTHIAEMTPIVYTPTVGEACERYSHIFRRARGLYLSYPDPHRMLETIKKGGPDDVAVIVVTDGERILGLGDLGVGGMGIPVGKLVLYTLCAGVDPRRTLPIVLDVGTNNPKLLNDPLYLGWKHPRLDRAEYDRFIETFVKAVHERWPRAILQWEDFSKDNAARLLDTYQHTHPSFNDDIQGTASVTVAGILRALKVTGESLKDQRVVIAGAGSAATGICRLLFETVRRSHVPEELVRRVVWLVDTKGLVHEGRPDLSPEKAVCAQSVAHLHESGFDPTKPIDLATVVEKMKATILIGTSGQPGMFTEKMVRAMAAHVKRPIIFPLSNPTSKSEAIPEDLMKWTDGRAIVATGSPFPMVTVGTRKVPIGQCNNAFIFPGVGLGLVASAARHVPEEVFLAAAEVLAAFDKRRPGYEESLFPNLENVREISNQIAIAVGRYIIRQGLSFEKIKEEEIPTRVAASTWNPEYLPLRRTR